MMKENGSLASLAGTRNTLLKSSAAQAPGQLLTDMLIAAFITLGIAVSIGSGLAIQYLHTEGTKPPPWQFALLHALFALGGLGCLLLALRGPPRGLDRGTGSFGIIAATLIVMAASVGGLMLAARTLKKRPAGILVGVHATLAVGGFVILVVYVFPG